MHKDFGFSVREEGDDFLILTCPCCTKDIMFTQFVDPVVIRNAVNRHANHCAAGEAPRRYPGLDSTPVAATVSGR